MSTVEERCRGSFLGLAWGDAFGCPLEGWWDSARIQAVYPNYQHLPHRHPFAKLAKEEGGRLRQVRPLGIYSDDTQQAMALLNTCLEGWQPWRWAQWIVSATKHGAWRGEGRSFQTAAQRLTHKSQDPRHAGYPLCSQGIGAAMRTAPLGALHRDDPQALQRVVWESSLMTHSSLPAASSAYAISLA
jgi:ADP-ribosyl-[dinitrogen reductase] hydrolase